MKNNKLFYVFGTKLYASKQEALAQYQKWIDDDTLRPGSMLLEVTKAYDIKNRLELKPKKIVEESPK